MMSQKNKAAMKNPWAIGLLLCFAVIVMVNITFIYLAFQQPPSLVSSDFYQRGERYEETLRKAQQEKQLKWTGTLLMPNNIDVNQYQPYDVIIQGQQGNSTQGSSVTFFAYRPSDQRLDFQLDMRPQKSGLYTANIAFPKVGSWDVIVEVKQHEQRLLITNRLIVLP